MIEKNNGIMFVQLTREKAKEVLPQFFGKDFVAMGVTTFISSDGQGEQ